jgi:hypothetical protein
MANHISHAALPYPVKGARFTLLVRYLNSSGVPTDPVTPDTEVSKDGAAFTDCTEEVATITGSNGMGYITLTGDETDCSALGVAAKVASGPNNQLLDLSPRVLPTLRSGTAQAGAAGTITLDSSASAVDDFYNGCIVQTTGGTGGGGGSGKLNNQARVITDYVGSTKIATVEPNWETTPDNTTTFKVLLTELALQRLAKLGGDGLDAVLVESGGTPSTINARQALSALCAANCGVIAGATSLTVTAAAMGAPATTRITFTVDGSGNRTAVTYNLPA